MSNTGVKPFKGQVWEELKRKHNRKNLFEDPAFPPTTKNIYYSQPAPRDAKWKRASEVVKNPQFVVNGFGRCDLDQGFLGNCWFIAGCIGIMQSEKCFAKVVPQDQGFGDDYGGIFHFRFWLYGEWVDVVIDDMLPFWPDGRLVFCSNKQEPNELWGALLEKAYAKLYGSYESLEGGIATDALIDMSGGVEEVFEIKSLTPLQKQRFWDILYQAYNRSSILACSIEADRSVKEAHQSNGLIKGHAYTITNLIEFESGGKTNRLIRIRNPWGDEREWTGSWSDKSKEWKSVGDDIKKKIDFVIETDGEFWMSYNDFMTNWDTVQVCHLNLEGISEEVLKTDDDSNLSWVCATYQSEWKTGVSAGGSGQPNIEKFWTNPQFFVTLKDVDENDNENMATLIVALMQKDIRLKRLENGNQRATEEYIQIRLFRVKNNVKIDENKTAGLRFYSNQLERVGTSASYINRREVTQRFRVPPGNYVIIPSTFDENRDCKFMLRIFTENEITAGELNSHKSKLSDQETQLKLYQTDQVVIDKNKPNKPIPTTPAKPNQNNEKPNTNKSTEPAQPVKPNNNETPKATTLVTPEKPNNSNDKKPKGTTKPKVNEPEDACNIM